MLIFWLSPKCSRPSIFKPHPYAVKLSFLLTLLVLCPHLLLQDLSLEQTQYPLGSPNYNLGDMAKWWAGLLLVLSPTLLVGIHCFWLLEGGFPHCQIIPGFPKLQIIPYAEGDAWLLVLISPKHYKKHSTEIEKIFLHLRHTWPSRSGNGAALYPKSQNPCIRSSFYCHLIPQNRNQT